MRFTLVFVFVSLFCVRLFAQTNPLHDLDEGLTGQNINWNYNMGYRFTALSDGDITQLGGRWTNGVNHTVRLYSYPSGTLLESVVVTGDIDWNYVNLSSPRAVTAGEQFVVAVRLDAQSSGCYGPINGVPVSSGGISIEGGTYRSNSNAMPTNLITNTMYGQADITFEPCVYAGSLSADKMEIISGDSAILEVTDNVGSIQWQFSEDGVNYTDIIGETSAQLNTGSLDSSRLYRTYVTGGACANDTSNPIEIAVLDPFYPWRNQNESLTGEGFNWNYNLGYRFTCNQAGDVTQLGGRWANGVTATVRLYSYPAGTVLATAVVDGNIDWAFEDITPVSLTSGDEYVVAVRFQNGDNAGCYSNSLNFPIDDGGITITAGTYLFNSDNMPTNTVSGIIYGQPDIRFSPCSYAGSLVAANNNIEIYDSTNITAVSPIGDIQWQFSSDGITYTDLSGETDSVLNTGVLLSNTYFRTYVTSGICSPRDTSDAILIKVYDPLKPLQSYDPNITSSGNNWNYNMGYRFTALASGNVTELGGRWGDGVVNTVRLYSYPSGTLLANQNVTGNGDWSYATLGSPVALTANQQYVVSVRLNNNSDGVYSSGVSFPTTEGQIRIDNGTYISNSNAMPTNSNLTTVYGQADLKFEPCVYGGEVQGDDDLICSGEQTRFECDYYLGTSFQWQSSIDGISFTDIAGANDSAVQTGALTQTTYYRFIASHACGNDTSNIDSVVVVGTGGGLARTWNPTDGTDWSNTCNWLEGAVPVTGDSVIIPYGVNAPTAIPAVNLRYLLMDNVNDITINNNLRITSQLELSRGIINVSSTGSITLEYVASFVGGYSTSYINLANGAYVERIYTVADGSNFTIPIGQNELTPITFGLNATSSLGASPNIRFQVTDGIHPSLGSPSDYLNTFWTFSTNDISNLSYNFSCEYANSDIVGSELNLTSALYNSSSGWSQYSPALPLTNTIFGFFATEEGDLTASNEFPYISANTGDWNLITTWLGGSVPGLSNDVVIRNTHEVTLAGGQSAESITIENGGTLDLNGNTLSLYGDLNNDGDFDGENSTLLVLGSAAQTLSFQDSVNLDRLYSSNSSGASISSGVLYLTDNLELANGDFNTNDSLVLVSNASGTARILELPSGSSVNGDVQIQRFVPLGAGAFGNWHMLSSPISGQTLEGWNDDVFTSGFPGSDYNNPSYFISMYAYDETVAGVQDSGYVPPTNITNALGSGVGYWVYQFNQGVDVTYDLTGAIHEGNTNFSLSYTDDFVEPSSEHGWNLVGNPYPCTIDLEDADWTRSNISTTYYIWNPAAQNFATYTLGGASTNGGSRYVSSMQAIFVKANNASATLSCTEGVKVDVDPAFLKIVQPSNQFKLILSNGTSSD
ncbi:MAG: DUF4082 domain-containing protein, partial [Flavobacteriales bacterium]|nr:DUF4082 domain-containing protein [Flavobacteriales bacterium]